MPLNFNPAGSFRGLTYQVTIASSTTPVRICEARLTRRSVLITQATGTVNLYFGFDSTVSATKGVFWLGVLGAAISIPTAAELWFIGSAAASQILTVAELLD